MTKKYVGKRMTRTEDPRLLTGQGLYVDDVEIHGMLYAAFLRSDYAHARIKSIDVSAARSRPGDLVSSQRRTATRRLCWSISAPARCRWLGT